MPDSVDPVAQARTIGERVHAQRARHGWTIYGLAVRAAVPLEEIEAIEDGAEFPSTVTISRLAIALAVSAAWLVGVADYL